MVVESILALNEENLLDQWNWILGCLREVLQESGDGDLAQSLPLLGDGSVPRQISNDSVHLTQAYSIAFQLLGMAEQNAADQFRKGVERRSGADALPALWGDSLRQLKESGLTSEQIARELPKMRIELVLTAHPTEAKRATVLAHHRRLFERFQQRSAQTQSHSDRIDPVREEIDYAVRAILSILWRTGEIYLDKPDIQSERRNVLDYLTHVFPSVLRPLDQRLRRAWSDVGLDPKVFENPLVFPKLTFGTWVGGDRDGHPLVTADVTRQSLLEMRKSAIGLIQRHLLQLARLLSLSAYWQKPNPEFLQALASAANRLGAEGKKALDRNPNEPWRQFINTIIARLPKQDAINGAIVREETPTYQRSIELLSDLRVLYDSLIACGQRHAAEYSVQPLMRIVQTFGFHLAVLDVRQNSAFHDRAVEQLLVAAGFERTNFSQWSEQERLDLLSKELASKRPFARPDVSLGAEADAVLSSLRVLKEYRAAYGEDGLGALIVSMTRNASDLLVVYLLAREVGLMEETPEGLLCPLPVVPLFETVDDLQHSPAIYDQFLKHPITQRSLIAIQKHNEESSPVGQIMIGYSDSNKDGGILASLVHLRCAQKELFEVGKKNGVRVRFFHGRGGTISRGAGPTHRFIKSLPDDTLGGDLRVTEQGETIPQKYAHQSTAIYNLELFLAGVTRKTLWDLGHDEAEHPLEGTLTQLAQWARECYTSLLHSDGFVTFFRQATPIDAIEQSRIGSRPARRTGQQTLADLRAIPWVFSWGQARFFLSGWYGVGTALNQLQQKEPKLFEELSKTMSQWAPVHYLISNVATSLAATDLDIMRSYAGMVDDVDLRNRCMGLIESELALTSRMVEAIYGGPLAQRRPNVQRMMNLRASGLRVLHQQQIGLLKMWRSYHRMQATAEADKLIPQLLLTVNAIASGLGTTG
ncbi:phosphoenolpyruvate carboxylase [Pirellulaceae bacterium SH501]